MCEAVATRRTSPGGIFLFLSSLIFASASWTAGCLRRVRAGDSAGASSCGTGPRHGRTANNWASPLPQQGRPTSVREGTEHSQTCSGLCAGNGSSWRASPNPCLDALSHLPPCYPRLGPSHLRNSAEASTASRESRARTPDKCRLPPAPNRKEPQ
jgi:hypothetical protein